jgi:hypothetical protein
MKQPWPIPAHLIKKEKVDYENEALSALGASVQIGHDSLSRSIMLWIVVFIKRLFLRVFKTFFVVRGRKKLLSKPLSLGVMTLLEVMDNALLKMMFTDDKTIEPCSRDLCAVFYLNNHRQNALEDVRQWFRGDKDSLNKKIDAFGKEYAINDNYVQYVIDMLSRSSLGFKMIPGKGEGSEMIYGAETIAGFSFICSSKMGIDYSSLIWEIPLTLIGHCSAISAIKNGTKNVERPHDLKHLKWFEETCEKCDEDGELYPFQKDNPFGVGLFKWQSKEASDKWVIAAQEWIKQNEPDPKKDQKEINRVVALHKALRASYLKELNKKK